MLQNQENYNFNFNFNDILRAAYSLLPKKRTNLNFKLKKFVIKLSYIGRKTLVKLTLYKSGLAYFVKLVSSKLFRLHGKMIFKLKPQRKSSDEADQSKIRFFEKERERVCVCVCVCLSVCV